MIQPGTEKLLRAVAAYGLPSLDPPVQVEVRSSEWEEFSGGIQFQKLSGIALAAADGNALALPPEALGDLIKGHRNAMLWALAAERKLIALTGEFRDAGIRVVLLKGPALAHTIYPDPSWRAFGDLDLMVEGMNWRAVCDILESRGFRARMPEPRPGFNERFGQGTTFVDGNELEVDLHRRLIFGAFGIWIDSDELFRRAVPFRLAGNELWRLDDTSLLLHACVHASLGARPPLLLPLRDVAQAALRGHVRWDDLHDLATKWRCGVVLDHAFRTTTEVLRIDLPADVRAFCADVGSPRDRRVLAAYTTPLRARGGKARSMLRVIPGLREKGAYLWALLLPGREFLAVREGSGKRVAYLRRWMTPVRWIITRLRRRHVLETRTRDGN